MKFPELRWPQRDGGYDDDLLLDIDWGVVAYLVRGRNAWNSTWVRHWFRNTNLFSDHVSAKHGAESLRGPGNVFYVRERPALLLRGTHESIVLCDLDERPFDGFSGLDDLPVDTDQGRWIDGVFPGVSLRDAVAAFGASSRHWKGVRKDEYSIHSGVAPSDYELSTGTGEFLSLESYSMGGKYELGWTTQGSGDSGSPIMAKSIAERWAQLVDAALRTSPDPGDRQASFVHYRDVTLGAQPHSQWLIAQEARRAAETARWDELWEASCAAHDQVRRLESELRAAEAELNSAIEAQFRTADTSAGVRAQRLRVEAARTAIPDLEARLEIAKITAADFDAKIDEEEEGTVSATPIASLSSFDRWFATRDDDDG